MIFTAAIATPANTAAANPVETLIPLVFGKITRVIVFFPPGVNALAHLKLLYGLVQLFPSNEQADFAGGDVLIDWDEDFDVNAEPTQLRALTWNQDDTYAHTITVHIVMTPAAGGNSVQQVLASLNGATS